MTRPDWDTTFMTAAFLFSQRSPDQETKVGAILVDKNNRLLSEGYNGFPAGCKDDLFPTTRPGKYFFMRHAEDNCIDSANVIPEPRFCTLYVTAKPCNICLGKIIHKGIGRVVYGGVKAFMTNAKDNEEYLKNYNILLKSGSTRLEEYNNKDDIISLYAQAASYVQDRC